MLLAPARLFLDGIFRAVSSYFFHVLSDQSLLNRDVGAERNFVPYEVYIMQAKQQHLNHCDLEFKA